jgi:hypothetical protein
MPEADAFFKFLLTLGLAENDRLYKLIVVDLLLNQFSTGERNIEMRWKEMLESVFVGRRFEFFSSGVASFMSGNFRHQLGRGEQIS